MTSEEEADHCADSAFPYLHYRRQHADCQAPKGIAFCRFLWYPCFAGKALFCKCSGHASPPRCHCSCHRQEEVHFLSSSDGSIVLHEILEGGFHHGSFRYCFSALNLLATVVIGVINVTWMISRGCLSGQTSGKTLFEKIMTRKMTARSYQTSAVMFSNVTSEEGS